MRVNGWLFAVAAALFVDATSGRAQDRGAAAIDRLIRSLTVTARVLIVGAHPDDEDTRLIAALARGSGVETAYLSLTRGESGVNFLGNESGDALGAIRTAEVLAARRIDAARQYFTRAFDFGFSRSAAETFEHWPHDAVLGDVITVIRSFRPHVVIALFTGTDADGNGHHAVSAILAREAFDRAADTTDFPVARHGYPWIPLKLYGPGRSLTMDAGAFDPVPGVSHSEIAAESRARHRTQGYADLAWNDTTGNDRFVRLDLIASRAGNATTSDTALFDGIDTTFMRLAAAVTDPGSIEMIIVHADSARSEVDLRAPDGVVRHLAQVVRNATLARNRAARCLHPAADAPSYASPRMACPLPRLDVDASVDVVKRRATEALLAASGVAVEMTAERELVAYGDSLPARLTLTNRGRDSVQMVTVSVSDVPSTSVRPKYVLPDSTAQWETSIGLVASAEPWWLGRRLQDLYPGHESALDGLARVAAPGVVSLPGVAVPEDIRRASDVTVMLRIAGTFVTTSVGAVVSYQGEPRLGIQRRQVSGVPAVGLAFDNSLQWFPADKPIDRLLRFSLTSFADSARTIRFEVVAPPGLRLDSLPESVTLPSRTSSEILLRMRGRLEAGRHQFGIVGRDTSDGIEYVEGLRTIQYPHLGPIRMSRGSGIWLQVVDIVVPGRLRVAYVQGVGDLITHYLRQLGVHVTVLGIDELLNADLSEFTTVVIGPRAYEAHPGLTAYNDKLLEFARRGGTVVVQPGTSVTYGLGVFPYPLGPASDGTLDHVTVENSPVTVLDPGARLLSWPNRIGDEDWKGWVTERGSNLPRVIDPRYTPLLEVHDPGEPDNRGAIVMTSLGRGKWIYTALSLHRQLAGAVPGAARLFVNLMSAGLAPESARPRER